jgi:hypothetical protein
MGTKQNWIKYFVAIALAGFLLASCAKVVTTSSTIVSNNTSQTTIASDEVLINNEIDQFVDYAVEALSNHHVSIPDVTVILTDTTQNIITLYYTGLEPDKVKYASGLDSVLYNGVWASSGAKATLISSIAGGVAYVYEIGYESLLFPPGESLNDTATLTFIGSITIENMNGKVFPIAPGDTLVVKITANNMQYTFNDNAAVLQLYTININQTRTYTMIGTTVYATTVGDTIISNVKNVGDWGVNRLGYNYYTSINKPIVQNISNYNLSYNPLSGVKDIQGIPEPIYCEYGQGGTLANGGPYGYTISWINDGVQNATTLHYYY